jgi:WD40 repeat protein
MSAFVPKTNIQRRNWPGRAFALVLGAAFLMPALAKAQTPDQMRAICKDPALQQSMLAQVPQEPQHAALALQIEARCATIDLPLTPVYDATDASREASHSDWVFDARYSRDGRTIVSASRDGTIRLWDAQTGKPIRRIVVAKDDPGGDPSRKGIVRSVTFVGDGTRVAAASDLNPVRLIELATGNVLTRFPVGSDDSSGTIAATAGGLLFIGGHADTVDAIDVNIRATRYRLPGHQMGASAIAVSETAGLIATAASSQYARPDAKQRPRVQIWRLGTGEKIAEFEPERDPTPGPLAFSRDGAQLAVVSGGLVHIYSVPDKRITKTLSLHAGSSPFAVAFTADGKGLFTGTTHPILWDLATGKRARHFGPFTDLCHSVDISPDGRFALTTSAGSDLRIWEISTGTFYRRLGINVHPPY